METVAILVMSLILLVFAGMVIFSITASRREKQARAQMVQTLGLTQVEPDGTLLAQVSALYRTKGNTPRHSLHNVTRRKLPDGELFLFDLVDRDIESHSWIERQAVAVRSDTLRLPPFQFYPKVDTEKYALGGLANKIVEWGVSKLGTVVRFPEIPVFEARYTVTSTDPEAVQIFFDERMARYFAGTEYYTLHAYANLFVFAEIETGFKINDQSFITRRINRALEMYRLFQK